MIEVIINILNILLIPLNQVVTIMSTIALSIFQIIGTAIAACAGAYAAFLLERRNRDEDKKNEQEEKKSEQIAYGNRAIYTLNRQRTILYRFWKDQLIPHKEDPNRFLSMGTTLPIERFDLKFDLKELEFLFYSSNPNLINDFLTVEDIFMEALKAINLRFSIFTEKLQPKIAEFGIEPDSVVPVDDIRKMVGVDLFINLKDLTDQIYDHVENGMGSAEKACQDLHNEMVKLFPSEKNRIISLKFPDSTADRKEKIEQSSIETESGEIQTCGANR